MEIDEKSRVRKLFLTPEEIARRKSEHQKYPSRTRVRIGKEFDRWRQFREELRLDTDTAVARLLLDKYFIDITTEDEHTKEVSISEQETDNTDENDTIITDHDELGLVQSIDITTEDEHTKEVSISEQETDNTDEYDSDTIITDHDELGLVQRSQIKNDPNEAKKRKCEEFILKVPNEGKTDTDIFHVINRNGGICITYKDHMQHSNKKSRTEMSVQQNDCQTQDADQSLPLTRKDCDTQTDYVLNEQKQDNSSQLINSQQAKDLLNREKMDCSTQTEDLEQQESHQIVPHEQKVRVSLMVSRVVHDLDTGILKLSEYKNLYPIEVTVSHHGAVVVDTTLKTKNYDDANIDSNQNLELVLIPTRFLNNSNIFTHVNCENDIKIEPIDTEYESSGFSSASSCIVEESHLPSEEKPTLRLVQSQSVNNTLKSSNDSSGPCTYVILKNIESDLFEKLRQQKVEEWSGPYGTWKVETTVSKSFIFFNQILSKEFQIVTRQLRLNQDLTYKIRVHGHDLKPTHEIYVFSGTLESVTAIRLLLSRINSFSVCSGLRDKDSSMYFFSHSDKKNHPAFKEGNFGGKSLDGSRYNWTIRTCACPLLISQKLDKCMDCLKYAKRAKVISQYKAINRQYKAINPAPAST